MNCTTCGSALAEPTGPCDTCGQVLPDTDLDTTVQISVPQGRLDAYRNAVETYQQAADAMPRTPETGADPYTVPMSPFLGYGPPPVSPAPGPVYGPPVSPVMGYGAPAYAYAGAPAQAAAAAAPQLYGPPMGYGPPQGYVSPQPYAAAQGYGQGYGPQQQFGQPGGYVPYPYGMPMTASSTFSVAAFMLAVITVMIAPVGAAAIVIGSMARNRGERHGQMAFTMSVAATVLGCVIAALVVGPHLR